MNVFSINKEIVGYFSTESQLSKYIYFGFTWQMNHVESRLLPSKFVYAMLHIYNADELGKRPFSPKINQAKLKIYVKNK